MTFDELLRATVQGDAHSSATGAMYPGARASSSSRPEQPSLDISSNFSGNNDPLGGHLPDQDSGPPYTVKNGQDTKEENDKPSIDSKFHGVKSAGHAHDRMVERTPFPRQHVNKLQTAADILDLGPGHYYLPLRKDGELHGYAQFKSVPQRKKPVLATILGKGMSPQGQNIEHLIKLSSIEPETNATLDKPPVTSSTYGDQLDSRPPGSTANRRAALHLGNQVSLEEGLRRAFDKLRFSDTNTVDQGSTDPEYGAQG